MGSRGGQKTKNTLTETSGSSPATVSKRRRNPLYGNENGLPGLPKTTYVTVGGRRVQPKPPRTQMRPVPPPAPSRTHTQRPIQAPPPRPIQIPAGPDPTLSRRIDSLDLRLNSTEQSNRTLLDELMRLQQDIKANVRKNEIGIQEERDGRSRLEMSLRQSQTKNHEIEDRIRRCEDGVKDNRNAIQQLSAHVTNIERMITSLQQDQTSRRSDSSNKVQEYRNDLNRLTAEKEQLERMVKNIQETGRDSTNRIDNLQSEIASLQGNLRMQSTLIQDYANKPKTAPPPPKTPGVDKKTFENTEQKLAQLNSTIQNLSGRVSNEASNREKAMKDLNNRLIDLKNEFNASQANSQQEYDKKMQEMQMGFTDVDKKQIKLEMSNLSQQLNSKIDKNDVNIRADTVDKLTVIEASLKEEEARRKEKEEAMQKRIEEGMKKVSEKGESDSELVKKTLDARVGESKEKLSALNKRMNEVEAALRDHKITQEKLLEAEIRERLDSDKILDAKIEDLEDDVTLGFKTLQNEIGQQKVSQKSSKNSKTAPPPPSVDLEEISQMQKENADGIRKHFTKELGTLEKRVAELELEVKQADRQIDNRIETAHAQDKEDVALMGDEIQRQIDGLVFKNNKLKKKVDDLERNVSDTPKNIQNLKEETESEFTELKKDLAKEKKERVSDVEVLKENIEKIVGRDNQTGIPSLAQLSLDTEQTQTGLKKCAESIHVVKVMLSEKVKDERKIREKECAILSTDVERLDTKIKELKERIKLNASPDDTLTEFDDLI